MKRSNIAALTVFFAAVPLTLFLGMRIPGRGYYVTATLIMIELMIPLFMAFEGRRPQARELTVLAVMCAVAVAGRVAIPIPHFKAAFALIMITGIAFGPECGFAVGAVTAFVSNFFLGQGAYLPWQMMAYGAGGLLSGFVFKKGLLPRKRIPMALFGTLAVVLWIGPLLDISNAFLMASELTPGVFAASLLSGLPVNLIQASCTALVMFFFGVPLLDKLDRVRLKYGMTEGADGI